MTRSFRFPMDQPALRSDRRRGRPRLRSTLVGLLASTLGLLVVLPFLGAAPAGAAQLVPRITNQSDMVDVALDAAGNIYESETNGNVNVWPVSSGTVFGHSVIQGQANTLVTLHDTPGIAFDANGDLFIADRNGVSGGSISVLPATSGTIFGQTVTANTLTTIVSGIDDPIGVTFDGAGNLYYATQDAINVLPASTTTLYGQAVSADSPAVLVSGLVQGGFIAFDSNQNLFYTDVGNQVGGAASVNVLPDSNGTIFGQTVTADTPTALASGLTDAAGLAVDGANNLYVDYYGTVAALEHLGAALRRRGHARRAHPDRHRPARRPRLHVQLGPRVRGRPGDGLGRPAVHAVGHHQFGDLRRIAGQPDPHCHRHRLQHGAPYVLDGLQRHGPGLQVRQPLPERHHRGLGRRHPG